MEQCPAKQNHCSRCVEIGKAAYSATFLQLHPDISQAQLAVRVENAHLPALIEEQGGLQALSCPARQQLAQDIGVLHAEKNA